MSRAGRENEATFFSKKLSRHSPKSQLCRGLAKSVPRRLEWLFPELLPSSGTEAAGEAVLTPSWLFLFRRRPGDPQETAEKLE